MKYILNKGIFIILIILPFSLLSQNDLINHQKYWYYKTRLNNDFIKIGMNSGESIPYNQRGRDQKGYPEWPNISGEFGHTNMLAGDGPSSLGVYIASLATEYGLLKTSNQSTDLVKHELFCALNAINRLDDMSEALWAWAGGHQISLNGFFIRDDIPKDFLIQNYSHFNYYSDWQGSYKSWNPTIPDTYELDKGFCSQILNGQFGSASSYSEIQNGKSPDLHTMSQDHVITLLIGLSLINKYVDYTATDNGAVFPYEGQNVSSIKQESWNIVDRIAQHFKNDPQYNLKNPVTNNIVQPGGVTMFTQYGLAESFCKAEGYNGPNTPFVPILNTFGSLTPYSCNYNAPIVQTGGLIAWGAYMTTPSTSVDNAGFKAHLLATGNCGWTPAPVNVASSVCNWVSTNVCNNLPWPLNSVCNIVNQFVCNTVTIPVPGFKNETASFIDITSNEHYGIEGLKEQQIRNYDFWDAPLLHRALFPSNANPNYLLYIPKVKDMLNNAPCIGPYNFGQFARPNFEWTCENRIEKPNNRQDYNEPDLGWMASLGSSFEKHPFKGEYNGTDYMLYHNLYRLTSGVGASGYQDLSHRYINITLPIGSLLCAKPNTCLFRAFETIVADNTINSNGAVEYKAGKIIDLKPGFYVVGGADFHAYIEPANCNNGAAGLRTAQDTTNSKNDSFAGYDNMGDDVLTHYVNYPQEKDSVRENLTEGILPAGVIETLTEESDIKALLINEASYENYFNIYPNPTDGIVNIEFSLADGEIATLYIINNNGSTIAQNEMPKEKFHKLILNTSPLAKGLYLIRLVTNNNRVEKKTLTVQ